MTSTLREWGAMWKQLYVLGLDLVPRKEFAMVDPDEISVTELYSLVGGDGAVCAAPRRFQTRGFHVTVVNCSSSSLMGIISLGFLSWDQGIVLAAVPRSALPTPALIRHASMEHRHRKKDAPAPASTHHLFAQVKSLMSSNLGEDLDVFFTIYDGRENRPLSERFFVRLNKQGVPKSPEKTEKQCTLFVDLGSSDLRKDVYIVVHIIRIGRMGAGEKKNANSTQYRR
ncbi:hypothetical protein Z043_125494, partial [Scleropages formosus]